MNKMFGDFVFVSLFVGLLMFTASAESKDLKTRVKRQHSGGPMLGDRCPFPPNEDGTWPDFCYDVIGGNCECLMDDMRMGLRQCVAAFGSDHYLEILEQQLDLEEERAEKRKEEGKEREGPNVFIQLLDCYVEWKSLLSLKK